MSNVERVMPRPLVDAKSGLWKRMVKAKSIYLFILPTLLYFLVFSYIPYYGLTIAFKDFRIFSGLAASPWVGLKHFQDMFGSPDFLRLVRNTVLISTYRIVFGFPVPIVFALLLNAPPTNIVDQRRFDLGPLHQRTDQAGAQLVSAHVAKIPAL